mmetsp:Transcript_5030/g.18309  ORF Transcript_5030/g.18309 Transcript_5030/m.18309 type:complete len:348 (+) Transcript_5030:51-1094(+)
MQRAPGSPSYHQQSQHNAVAASCTPSQEPGDEGRPRHGLQVAHTPPSQHVTARVSPGQAQANPNVRRDLAIARNSLAVFSEMLDGVSDANPQAVLDDLISELAEQCEEMQPRLMGVVDSVVDEDALAEALELNDLVVQNLRRYQESLTAAREASSRADPARTATVGSEAPPVPSPRVPSEPPPVQPAQADRVPSLPSPPARPTSPETQPEIDLEALFGEPVNSNAVAPPHVPRPTAAPLRDLLSEGPPQPIPAASTPQPSPLPGQYSGNFAGAPGPIQQSLALPTQQGHAQPQHTSNLHDNTSLLDEFDMLALSRNQSGLLRGQQQQQSTQPTAIADEFDLLCRRGS